MDRPSEKKQRHHRTSEVTIQAAWTQSVRLSLLCESRSHIQVPKARKRNSICETKPSIKLNQQIISTAVWLEEAPSRVRNTVNRKSERMSTVYESWPVQVPKTWVQLG